MKKHKSQHEHYEQAKFFRMINYLAKEDGITRIDEAFLTFAIPNSAKRSVRMGAYMKAEGLKSGVPDIIVPILSERHIGLAIEMKYGKNKPEPNQEKWHKLLRQQKWRVVICYSAEEAFHQWAEYLGLPEDSIELIERAFLFQEAIL